MKVIPAIDLQNGKCVRLLRGQFDQQTEYSDNPSSIARIFANFDVDDLHVVDLDGARTGKQENTDAICGIARETRFNIQLGGGIRYAANLEHWFDNGVRRCVVGSLCVQNPIEVKEWLKTYGPERIVLALDVNIRSDGKPMIATNGWAKTSNTTLWDCIEDYANAGLKHLLCTDISRDGAMTGPNVKLYSEIISRYPSLDLQASGGVRNAADLRELRDHGITAAITGRALLEGALSADEVSSFRQNG